MLSRKSTTMFAVAIAAAFGASVARADVQDYSAATGAPGTGVDHPGFGFFQADFGGWDAGLDANHPGEFEFAGSDGAFHMETFTLLNQGFTGRTGDHAAHFVMDYNPHPPDTSFGTFWFGGVGNDIGPLPSTTLSNVLAYADVIAPDGKPIEFRTESDFGPNGNGFKFYGTGNGTWQTIGGQLSAAVAFGNFNFTVKATDLNGCQGVRAYALTIIQPPALSTNAINWFRGWPKDVPKRFSLKFRHNTHTRSPDGSEVNNHDLGCTTCHINIAQMTTLNIPKADVPIAACGPCHSSLKSISTGPSTSETIYSEITNKQDATRKYTCVACHTPVIGREQPPCTHYQVTGQPCPGERRVAPR